MTGKEGYRKVSTTDTLQAQVPMSLQNKQKTVDSNTSTPRTNKQKGEIMKKMQSSTKTSSVSEIASKRLDSASNTQSAVETTLTDSEKGGTERTQTLLINDTQYYELEKKRMMHKILNLTM